MLGSGDDDIMSNDVNPVTTRAALLQALISGPGYGLDLIERVDEQTKGRVKLHQGSVYPALRALVREGLLKSEESQPQTNRGGRPRIYYRLTPEGLRSARADGEVFSALAGPRGERHHFPQDGRATPVQDSDPSSPLFGCGCRAQR